MLIGSQARNAHGSGSAAFTEGAAPGPFATSTPWGGPASALAAASAWLGDVAIASPTVVENDGGLQIRMQRHYERGFAAPVSFSAPGGPVSRIALALDFRSDAIIAWQQAGSIFARAVIARGGLGPIQRLGPAGPSCAIVALDSDDYRGMVAWADQGAGSTSIYADVSAPGVRFGSAQLLERFRDPYGVPASPGSLQLIRLAGESVMIAWDGAQQGRYAVRVATVSDRGVRPPQTISQPGEDALLSAFVPGPANEVLALWSVVGGGPAHLGSAPQKIYAAHGIDIEGVPSFDPPEQVASTSGSSSEASVAFDPSTNNALAVWREGTDVRYSLRSPAARLIALPPLAPPLLGAA